MYVSADLVVNALVAGLLLGGFYAAVTVGVSVSFGILDIVNIAHPGFIILGSYIAYIVNARFGIDPILIGIVALPAFYALGAVTYQVYYVSFEKRGQDALRGLAFFFGLLFITEVTLILVFGVDYRYVSASYVDMTYSLGLIHLPMRMVVPCLMSLLMLGLLQIAINSLGDLCFVLAAGAITHWLARRPLWSAVQRWVLGAVLAGIALRLAVDTRK